MQSFVCLRPDIDEQQLRAESFQGCIEDHARDSCAPLETDEHQASVGEVNVCVGDVPGTEEAPAECQWEMRARQGLGYARMTKHNLTWIREMSNMTTTTTSASAMVRRSSVFSDPALLRGSRFSDMMRCGGSIFVNNAGSERTYHLSTQVNRLDFFISHNWATPRMQKFSCLALHFNTEYAVMASLVVMVASAVLSHQDFLPTFDDPFGRSSVGCRVLGIPVFVFVLFVRHELLCRNRWCDPIVFLDKTCIHQTNEMIKKKGIQKLSAFLIESSKMVIVYTDVYLQRLWTVYEIASYLALHPGHDIVLLPTSIAQLVLKSMAFLYLTELGLLALSVLFSPEEQALVLAVNSAVIWPGVFGFTTLMRAWARDQAKIHTGMRTFLVQSAVCYDENDRQVVQGNIVAFMRKLGFADGHCSEAEALDVFNHLVRRDLVHVLASSIGRVGLPYWNTVAVIGTMALLPEGLDRMGGGELSLFRTLTYWLYLFTLVLAVLPICMAACARLCKEHLHLEGKKEIAYLALVSTVTFTFVASLRFLSAFLTTEAAIRGQEGDPVYISIAIPYCLTLFILAFFWLYRPVEFKDRRSENLSPESLRVVQSVTIDPRISQGQVERILSACSSVTCNSNIDHPSASQVANPLPPLHETVDGTCEASALSAALAAAVDLPEKAVSNEAPCKIVDDVCELPTLSEAFTVAVDAEAEPRRSAQALERPQAEDPEDGHYRSVLQLEKQLCGGRMNMGPAATEVEEVKAPEISLDGSSAFWCNTTWAVNCCQPPSCAASGRIAW